MQQQKIPKHLEEGEDTLVFLDKVTEVGGRKKCRYGKACGRVCIRSSAICHVRLDKKLDIALERMRNFLAGRTAREAAVLVAAKDAILAFKAQQLSNY